MTYLVESLAPNTIYYFRIRSQNGCMTGGWSNEISAKTRGLVSVGLLDFTESEIIPVPTETPIIEACKTHIVKSGESLWTIAKSLLGDANDYTEIIRENKAAYPSLETSNSLQLGWKLRVNCGSVQEPNQEISQPAEEIVTEGYKFKIKVTDTDKKPIEGAKVTIHSNVQEAVTNAEGIAEFSEVEPGDHKVLIAYKGFEGEQSVNLSGEVKEFDLNITIQPRPLYLSPLAYGIIAVMGVVIVILSLFLLKRRRNV